MQLQVEDDLILSCIKINSNPTELEQINNLIPLILDWDYLITTIIDRGIGPLFYKKVSLLTNISLIPQTVKSKLQQVYYKTFSRSTILYDHFRKIADAFVSHNIPVITLKGIYLSEWLYQDIGLRQFSDIDLLVKEGDGEKCLKILSNLGYKPSEISLSELVLSKFELIHYPAMVLDGVSVEIHIKLHSENEKYNILVTELWKNAVPTTINGIDVFTLNTYDLLIHLCLHLDKHFKTGHVQFTCFNDITNLLERVSDTLNWTKFTESCKLYKCEEIVFKYIIMTNIYMQAFVPTDIIQKYSSLLTEEDELLFINYLKSITVDTKIKRSLHFDYLKNNKKFSDKIKYVLGVLFPSKAFMIQKYKIKKRSFIFLYYPYRYYIGLLGIINSLLGKK